MRADPEGRERSATERSRDAGKALGNERGRMRRAHAITIDSLLYRRPWKRGSITSTAFA